MRGASEETTEGKDLIHSEAKTKTEAKTKILALDFADGYDGFVLHVNASKKIR